MNGKSSATITHLLTGLGIAVTIAIFASGAVYTAYSKNQATQDKRIEKVEEKREGNSKNIQQLQIDVTTIQKDVEQIRDDIEDSKIIQQKILDKLEMIR